MTEPLRSKEAPKPQTKSIYLEEDAPVERSIAHALVPQRVVTPDGYLTELADRARAPAPSAAQAPKPPPPLEKAIERARAALRLFADWNVSRTRLSAELSTARERTKQTHTVSERANAITLVSAASELITEHEGRRASLEASLRIALSECARSYELVFASRRSWLTKERAKQLTSALQPSEREALRVLLDSATRNQNQAPLTIADTLHWLSSNSEAVAALENNRIIYRSPGQIEPAALLEFSHKFLDRLAREAIG
jgi:hypothetical protein